MNRKAFLISLFLFASFVFTSCMQVVEYITKPIVSFEDGGIVVNESDYFAGGKKTSDWLFIMYMDADNSLFTDIKKDFNEVEQGLSIIRNSSAYASVRVVVLWDGVQYKDSRIFELGPDSNDNYLPGSLTYNIQNLKSFRNFNSKYIDMSEFNNKEVNMAQGETLTKFLEWVNQHYEVNKGRILHVADHGSGPGLNTRAMCQDSTNKTMSMSSLEFSDALKNAGCGNNKLDAILFDICLGASFEDAYMYNNYAKYMIASPNSTPGAGFNYISAMQCFKNTSDIEQISIDIGKSFKEEYKDYSYKDGSNNDLKWYDLVAKSSKNTYVYYTKQSVDDINKNGYSSADIRKKKINDLNVEGDKINWYLGNNDSYTTKPIVPTITVIKLSAINDCATAINKLAETIMLQSEDKQLMYIPYLLNHFDEKYDYSIYYVGNINWLFDVGYFAHKMTAFTELKNDSDKVKENLKNAIVYSWRPGYINNKDVDFYEYLGLLNICGIPICGGMAEGSKTLGIPSWYRNEGYFGASSNGWGNLLESWFGKGSLKIVRLN